MEKVIENGLVAVLYSSGYGAGWYTCNTEFPDCLFNPELVNAIREGKLENCREIAKILYGDSFYVMTDLNLKIKWLPVGTQFNLDEYDGKETFVFASEAKWITA